MATVRTVLDDLPAADLGQTNYHEHLFQASPLVVGDELDSESASAPVYWVETSQTEDGPGGLITSISDYSVIERAGGMASLVVDVNGRWSARPNPDHRGYFVRQGQP